jgi:hypothetical protein
MPESIIPNGHDRAVDRAEINRANAQKSTGPRTPAGKQRSSLNALRHGLTGHTIVLPSEDQAAYQRHSRSFLDEYQPQGATETQLVQSITDVSWQLNRAAAVETNLFSLGITESEDRIRASHPDAETALAIALAYREHNRAFANLGIYRQRLAREFERTLILLRQIQAERRANDERQLDNAAKILKMHQDANLPYQPSDDGFVFSKAEIEAYIGREERWQQANDHELAAYAS